MKVAIFGASGALGRRVVLEGLARGHEITGGSRHPEVIAQLDPRVEAVFGDATLAQSVARVVAGQDAVVSAIGPVPGESPRILVDAADALVRGMGTAGVKRLVVVGAVGALQVSPGRDFVDSPEFPAELRRVAFAHRDALAIYRRATGLDWTYVSPAAVDAEGARTGKYRSGDDALLSNAAGQSRISAEDLAVAIVDELEHPMHLQQRLAVAW